MEMLYYVASGTIMETIHGNGRLKDITEYVCRLAKKKMVQERRLDGKMKKENGCPLLW
tara:strand:+ start:262 stop:435 length:174 start_codon:yes stop_codon:yes gene_type:complete